MKLVVHLTVECGTYPTSGSNSVRPHAVTGAGSNTYVYDANGNMTSGAGRTIAYDHENRPTSITKNGTTTNFLYDGDGGRAKKTVDDGRLTVETIYISELYVCTVTVSPSCAKMIFSGSQRIAMVQINDGSTSYFHPDHLGSTSVLTDSHGVSEQDVAYYPYGETRTDTSTTTPVLDIAYKYTGKEQDDSTGLYFYEARYYDPVLGRFISADTIVPDPLDPQTLNRFSYVLNNPLKLIDPSGNISIGFGGGGFGGGYGGSSLGGYGG
ncbi:MAG: RHS repeat-associated core domain-containing protein, partial [Nitrospirales bacterium]